MTGKELPSIARLDAIGRPSRSVTHALRACCVWTSDFGWVNLKGERGSLAETSGRHRELFRAAARSNEEYPMR